MQFFAAAKVRLKVLFCLAVLGAIAALIVLPREFRSQAGAKNSSAQPVSRDEMLENYDIRADKTQFETITAMRGRLNRSAVSVADAREKFVDGENALRAKIPTLKVEYNQDIRTPEVIAPQVNLRTAYLTAASNQKHSEILRSFVKQNNDLVGVSDAQADSLKLAADYTNPDGNLSFVEFDQEINGIPVFRGEVKAGFTKQGEMIRVINNLAPGLDYESLSNDFREPLDAVKAAAGFVNYDLKISDTTINAKDSTDLKTVFSDGATIAEKMYFPTEPGVAIPAWRVLLGKNSNDYYVIVDAESGRLLWRKNITEDQSQPATYNVYVDSNAMINVAHSPFPLVPGPLSPTLGQQGAGINRTPITLIGNESPYNFNNLGWITDGGNSTDGNNVQAGLDRKLPNDGGTASDIDADGVAVGANRVFDFPLTPGNPNTNSGDNPLPAGQTPTGCLAATDTSLPTDFQKAVTTQLFYTVNRYHDEMYRLGFTEAARNFQNDNFGRGGAGGDRVSAQAQDCSGTNNANFSTPADGARPQMQMYLWTGPTPDFDGSLDADVVIHEATHGLSNRLHGNASGLAANMSRGMGEGWSDFYAHCLLSKPTDPINGIYTIGGYATYFGSGAFTGNNYYGIRRFPKAVMSFTGGANNLPHNPLTFADVDSTQFNIGDGAFARGPFGSSTVDQVHNLGEIWSTALWETRALFVQRLGWATGNRRILQFVTDGMKLAPLSPTFLQERDAIIAAAQASLPSPQASSDVADLWEGFRIRGMGAQAVVNNSGSGANDTRVTQSFAAPNLVQTPALTVSDSTGNNNGFPEPGENITLSIALFNNTGINADNAILQIVGGNSTNYGQILNNATVSRQIAYTIPANTPCGSVLTLSFNVTSSLGATSFTRTLIVGVPNTTFTENFDGVASPALPAGWTTTQTGAGTLFVTTTANSDTAPNSIFTVDPTVTGGGADITSPSVQISAAAATVTFRHKYDTEGGWDGGVLEISIGGAAFQDILAAGGRFVQGEYNGTLGNASTNPLANRSAWSGNSGGNVTTVAQLPASANGQNVQFRWRFGADNNTAGPGWNIDSIKVSGSYNCGSVTPTTRTRFDFDGDGKSDVSIFRPSSGEWWLLRSIDNQSRTFTFGAASDKMVPADFTGDGKTDVAFWRPNTGEWFVLRSEDFTYFAAPFGQSGDAPAPADFDADGKADLAVFRPSAGTWFINLSAGGSRIVPFGQTGDVAEANDYDGDGRADIAIFRPSTGEWWLSRSSLGQIVYQFGASTDKPVPADYTGDGKTDVAFWRPAQGFWYILRSENSTYYGAPFGQNGDVPVPADYDGDGRADLAVFRPSDTNWYLNRSTAGFQQVQFGLATDKPVEAAFIP